MPRKSGHRGDSVSWDEQVLRFSRPRPEILRATLPECVLAGFGQQVRSSMLDMPKEELAALWQLSQPTDGFHEFVSHSWTADALPKTLALLWYYNGLQAYVAALLAGSITFALRKAGVLPAWVPRTVDAGYDDLVDPEAGMSFWCSSVGASAFVLFFCFGQRLRPQCSKVLVFFDKLCVNQVDEGLKAEGVMSLGAFLKLSDKVLVLWTPTYFERLWCTFELACYLYMHPKPRVIFFPTCYGSLLTGIVSLLFALYAFWHMVLMINVTGAASWVLVVVETFLAFVPMYFWVHICRRFVHARSCLQEQVQTFSLSNAKCREQADQRLIFKYIEKWYRDYEHTASCGCMRWMQNNDRPQTPEAQPPEADPGPEVPRSGIENFNVFVRTTFCQRVCDSFLSTGLPYWAMVVYVGLPDILTSADMICDGHSPRGWVLACLSAVLVTVPLCVRIIFCVCQCFKQRCATMAADVALNTLTTCLALAPIRAIYFFRRETYRMGLWFFLGYTAGLALLLLAVSWRSVARAAQSWAGGSLSTGRGDAGNCARSTSNLEVVERRSSHELKRTTI